MDEPDNRTNEGLDGSEYRVWAKRNNIHRKNWSDMTEERRRHAKEQRRLVNDLLNDLDRREKTRWDR